MPIAESYLETSGVLTSSSLFQILENNVLPLLYKYPQIIFRMAFIQHRIRKFLRANPQLKDHPPVIEKIKQYKTLNANDLRYYIQDSWEYRDNPIRLYGGDTTRTSSYVLRRIASNISTIFKSLKNYYKNPSEYSGKPGFINFYRDGDLVTIEIDKRNANIVRGEKGLDLIIGNAKTGSQSPLVIPIPIYNDRFLEKQFQTVKIKTIAQDYYKISICYDKRFNLNPEICYDKWLSLDIGGKIICAGIRNDVWNPFLISAGPIRAANEFAKMRIGKLQTVLKQRCQDCTYNQCWRGCDKRPYWTTKMYRIAADRNQVLETYLHKVSSFVIEYCIENKIGNLVIGHNKGQKQKSKQKNKDKKGKTGFYYKKTRRMFNQIPVLKLIHQIEYKGAAVGINVSEREESNTSYLSALDCEYIPKTPRRSNKEKRKKRGMFQWSGGEIHADINGALNILRKEIGDSFISTLKKQHLHPAKYISI